MSRKSRLARGLLTAAGLLGAAVYLSRRSRRWSLSGKVVLITGGARGLGLALAREFASRGARLALCSRNADELSAAKQELRSETDVLTVVCDLGIRSQVEAMIATVQEHFGAVDVLVNNAGIIQMAPMESNALEDYEEAMQVHYFGPLYAILAALPGMRERGGGRIVNIASIGGKVSMPHLLPYSASKFALVGLSEGLYAELAKDKIYVTTVCPGLMRTGGHKNAYFRGPHAKEYALFSWLATSPWTAIPVERAAHAIVEAAADGLPEVILSMPAMVAARLGPAMPGVTAEILSWVNRFLPRSDGDSGRHRGKNIASGETKKATI